MTSSSEPGGDLLLREAAELEPSLEILTVESVEPFGVFLRDDNGARCGFIHLPNLHEIVSIDRFRDPRNIAEWFPVGCRLKVKQLRTETRRDGSVDTFYIPVGFADVVTTEGHAVVVNALTATEGQALRLLPPK